MLAIWTLKARSIWPIAMYLFMQFNQSKILELGLSLNTIDSINNIYWMVGFGAMFTWSYRVCNFCSKSAHFIYSLNKWLSNRCTLVWNNANFFVRKYYDCSLKECPRSLLVVPSSWIILKIPRNFASHGVQFPSQKKVQISHHL